MEGFDIIYHGGYMPDDDSRLYLEGLRSVSKEKMLFYNVSKDGAFGGVNRIAFIGFLDGFVKDVCVDATGGSQDGYLRIVNCANEVFSKYDFVICLQTGSHFTLVEKSFEAMKVKLPRRKYACVFSLASMALPNIARKRDAYVEVLGLERNDFLDRELMLADITRGIVEYMIEKSETQTLAGVVNGRDEKKSNERAEYFRNEYKRDKGLE